jgi:hypothetical protein
MILESAQMLCAVWHRYGETFPGIYKETHKNHPCTLWAGENTANYYWLCDMMQALNSQRVNRGKANHKSYTTLYPYILRGPSGLPVASERTPFAMAMPEQYKGANPVISYRHYLRAKRDEWRTRGLDFTYKDREAPGWIQWA